MNKHKFTGATCTYHVTGLVSLCSQLNEFIYMYLKMFQALLSLISLLENINGYLHYMTINAEYSLHFS